MRRQAVTGVLTQASKMASARKCPPANQRPHRPVTPMEPQQPNLDGLLAHGGPLQYVSSEEGKYKSAPPADFRESCCFILRGR